MKGFTAQSTQSTPFSSQYGGGEGLDVDFWISTDDACVYAGGSWVYNFGGQKRCGCRDQSSPYVIENAPRGLVELNKPGYKLKSITSVDIEGLITTFSVVSLTLIFILSGILSCYITFNYKIPFNPSFNSSI
jgi:hypothetical protein